FVNGSSSVSGTVMDTPPIPRVLDGKIENWSPCAKGTVRIWMSWAAPGGASVASDTPRRETWTARTKPEVVMRYLLGQRPYTVGTTRFPPPVTPGSSDERAVAQLGVGAAQLRLGVHHDRPVPRHGLLDRSARDEQEPDPGRPGLHADLVARVEEDERPIAGLVPCPIPPAPAAADARPTAGPARSPPPPAAPAARSPDPLRLDAAGRRGVAEPAAPLEHIGEGVPR